MAKKQQQKEFLLSEKRQREIEMAIEYIVHNGDPMPWADFGAMGSMDFMYQQEQHRLNTYPKRRIEDWQIRKRNREIANSPIIVFHDESLDHSFNRPYSMDQYIGMK